MGKSAKSLPLVFLLLTQTIGLPVFADFNDYKTALDKGVAAQKEEDYDEAEACFRAALSRATGKDKIGLLQRALSTNYLGMVLAQEHKDVEAEARKIESIALFSQYYGPKSTDLAFFIHDLAQFYANQKQFDKAQIQYQRNIEIWGKATDQTQLAKELEALADLYYGQGKYAQAAPIYQRSLEIKEKILSPNDIQLAYSLRILGTTLRKLAKLDEAEVFLRRSIAICRGSTDASRPLVMALSSYSLLQLERGNLSQAEALSQEAVGIMRSVKPSGDILLSSALNNLGLIAYRRGRYEQAEAAYKESLEISTAIANDSEVANTLDNLANLYFDSNRFAQAEEIYKRDIELKQKVKGENHPDVALSMNNLGLLYALIGRHKEAEQMFDKSLSIKKKVFGDEHPEVARTLCNLGTVFTKEGKPEQAESFFLQGLALLEKTLGPDNPEVANTLANYASFLYHFTSAKNNDSEAFYKRALTIREKSLGENNPLTAKLLAEMTDMYLFRGQYAKAEEILIRRRKIAGTGLADDQGHNEIQRLSEKSRAMEAQILIRHMQAEFQDPGSEKLAAKMEALQHAFARPKAKQLARASDICKQVKDLTATKYGTTSTQFADVLDLEAILAESSGTIGGIAAGYEKALHIRQRFEIMNAEVAATEIHLGRYLQGLGAHNTYIAGVPVTVLALPKNNLDQQIVRREGEAAANSCRLDLLDEVMLLACFNAPQQARLAARSLLQSENTIRSQLTTSRNKHSSDTPEKTRAKVRANVRDDLKRLQDIAMCTLLIRDYATARRALGLALELAKMSALQPQLQAIQTKLAQLDIAQTDFGQALEDATRARKLAKTTDEKISSLELLAGARAGMHADDEAAQSLRLATKLAEKRKGFDAPHLIALKTSYAALLSVLNKDDQADSILSEVIHTYAKLPGLETKEEVGKAFLASGNLALKLEQFERAKSNYASAIDYLDPCSSPQSRMNYLLARDGFGVAQIMLKDATEGRMVLLETATATNEYVNLILPQLSFAEQCAFIQRLQQQKSFLLSYCNLDDSLTTAYNYLLQWKGALIEGLRREAYLSTAKENYPNLKDKIAQLQLVRKQISQLSLSQESAQAKTTQERIKALVKDKESLERELNAQAEGILDFPLAQFEDPLAHMDATGFAKILNNEELFVDIYAYESSGQRTEKYAAILSARGQTQKFVDLGNKSEIDSAVADWRAAACSDGVNETSAEQTAHLKTCLRALLDNLPASATKVIICSDSHLSRLPWNAVLPELLHRQVLVSEVDSPREFVAFRCAPATVPQKPQVLLAGGIDFTGRNLNPLGASLNEVKEIDYEAKEMGIDSILLTSRAATKERIRKTLPTVSYAHFATHGFSHHGDDSSSEQEMRGITVPMQSGKGKTESLIAARNPLTDSGIYLSLPDSEKADLSDTGNGAITGEELIGMDLRKCDLVTLSACQTGLGKEFTGQGVLGLRAAIMAAGAKSLLMSLWSVPDASTRELMNRFYHYVWEEHKGKSEALSLAQKDVRSHDQWKAPKYWAAWVLAGKGW